MSRAIVIVVCLRAAIAQLPMAVVMIGLTVTGLAPLLSVWRATYTNGGHRSSSRTDFSTFGE